MSPDGTQVSFSATYGGRSDEPRQFTIKYVSWTSTCCDYVLNIGITNSGETALDTDQIVSSASSGNFLTAPSGCASLAPGMQCQLTFHVNTLTSYVIVVTDSRNGDQIYLITPG
jgi:hypothetical protein